MHKHCWKALTSFTSLFSRQPKTSRLTATPPFSAAFTSLADDHSIAVYAADAVGHGKSGGTRAYIERFSDVVSDFEGLCTTASEELAATDHPKPPMFIGGHSLGGLVAALTCLQLPNQFAGLLLCSPAVDVEWTPVLRMQAAVGNLLASVVPKARIVPAVDPKNLNKDPKKVEEYLNDPLITAGPMASRTANETLKVRHNGGLFLAS